MLFVKIGCALIQQGYFVTQIFINSKSFALL